MKVLLSFLVVLLCASAVCGTLLDELTTANLAFEQAYNTNDPVRLANCYTEYAILMAPGAAPLPGRANIATYWYNLPSASGAVTVKLGIEEVGPVGVDNGDVAYQRSQYILYKKDGTVVDQGKWVGIHKNTTGGWLLQIDIFNTNIPPKAEYTQPILLQH